MPRLAVKNRLRPHVMEPIDQRSATTSATTTARKPTTKKLTKKRSESSRSVVSK